MLAEHVHELLPNEKIDHVRFRDEEGYFLTLTSPEGKQLYRKGFPWDAYLNAFQYGLFFRPCCYQCLYACPQRVSDLTVGDFWGLGQTTYPKKKVSVILTNTIRGGQMLSDCKNRSFLMNDQLSKRSEETIICIKPLGSISIIMCFTVCIRNLVTK